MKGQHKVDMQHMKQKQDVDSKQMKHQNIVDMNNLENNTMWSGMKHDTDAWCSKRIRNKSQVDGNHLKNQHRLDS